MSYKSVYFCEECKLEEPAAYFIGANEGPATPELPQKWWQMAQVATTSLTFCSGLCLARYTGRNFGEPA